MKQHVTLSFAPKWKTPRNKKQKLSASIIQNTQSFLDNYTNESCQQKQTCSAKNNRSLLTTCVLIIRNVMQNNR